MNNLTETHTVKAGETLSGISKKLLGDASRWKELGYTGDPTKLQIGTVLTIPGTAAASTVSPTLESIQAGLKDVASQLPGVQADISALAEVDTTGAPALDIDTGDVAANGASLQAQFEADQKAATDAIEAAKKEAEEKAKAAAAAKKGVLGAFKDVEDIVPLDTAQLTKDVLAEYGLTPESIQEVQGLIAQLAIYGQQAVALENQKQAAMGTSEQAGMPTTYIRGEQALIERQYNSKISAKAAQSAIVSQQIQMTRGLWDDARATTSLIVNAAIYDQQQMVADLKWNYEVNIDIYNMSTDEEQTAWDRQYTLAQDELDRLRTEKTNVNNLMLGYPKAGILITDTVDEATKKASAWTAKQPAADVKALMAQYPTAGISLTDTFEEATRKVGAMPGEAVARRTQLKEIGGRTLLIDLDTGETIKDYGVTDIADVADVTADAQIQTNITGMQDTITQLDDLTTDRGGLAGALSVTPGTGWLQRKWYSLSGKTQGFIASTELIVSQMTLDKLVSAKARGATFGALSDKELQLLAAAASKIGTWAIKDKNGKVTGYNIDEKSFLKEVENIKKLTNRAIEQERAKAGAFNFTTPSGSIEHFNTRAELDEFKRLLNVEGGAGTTATPAGTTSGIPSILDFNISDIGDISSAFSTTPFLK